MAVTVASSQAIIGGEQKDGRTYVNEIFNLSNGRVITSTYLAPVGFDTAAHLAAAAVQVLETLNQSEIGSNVGEVVTLGSLASPSLVYSTAAENFAALRAFYQSATHIQAVMTGDFLNTLTNGQLATAFGITTGQAATLRTNKLAPAASLATSIRASTGQ